MKSLLHRPRRLRGSAAIRDLVRETHVRSSDLVLPLFISERIQQRHPVQSMPGVFQLTLQEAVGEAAAAWQAGVRAVLLFGIPSEKDAAGQGAYAEDGIVQRTVRLLKKNLPDLLVITDVCLCEYTSHGHCGSVQQRENRYRILNDESVELLVRTALSHAAAGADIVAPSDMMDGRIGAIREQLDASGYIDTAIMSYAVKYCSALYGPFRDAGESAPQFGDRRTYQMDPANSREALREAALDAAEGADILMVKPGLPYLDVLWQVRQASTLPVAVYNVSGEYAMVKAAAANGWLQEQQTVLEMLTAFKRAGADMIITYWAAEAAGWLAKQN